MTEKETCSGQKVDLRKQAERIIREKAAQSPGNREALLPEETRQALQELRVHQIELEMQNEELRRTQAELDAARARYFDLYNLAPVGYVTISEQGLILEANFTIATMLGVARGMLVKRRLTSFILKDDHHSYYRHRKQIFEAGEPPSCELRLVKQDGIPFWVRFEAAAAQDGSGAPVCRIVMSDITTRKHAEEVLQQAHEELERQVVERTAELRKANEELRTDIAQRKRVEEELKESKALIEAVVENVPLMIFLKEATDLRFVIFNRAGEELLGYDRRDLIGKNNLDLFPPEQAAHFMAKDRSVLDGEMDILDIPEEPIMTAKKGQRLLHTQKVCIRGGDGVTKYLLGISEDITERKRAEEEKVRLEGQLHQAQKMESVGRLAGGVAHDFNNMLGVILGHAEMAMEQVDPSQPIHADLEEIRTAAIRSADLTRQLLAFARKQIVAPKVLDLNKMMDGMLKMLRRLIGEDITLAWLPGTDLQPVKIDASQIDQILANLCVNARDAIAGIGNVTVETANVAFDETYCADHADFVPGEYIMIALSDDGCGMDKETLSHLFEPFFTTKVVGKGTGLGLATVYGIVKQNNGFINVYSEPGRGTTFKIYLPRHVGKTELPQTKGLSKAASHGQETILLVEDEQAILELTTMLLKRQGYTVLAASTPGEAIRLAREQPGELHLLMTDVVMPEMNGRDLANNLLSNYPHLKRLFMSGYTADIIAHHGVLDEGVHFIQKPFSIRDLAAKVRDALDGK